MGLHVPSFSCTMPKVGSERSPECPEEPLLIRTAEGIHCLPGLLGPLDAADGSPMLGQDWESVLTSQ
jgi:hypothetical protein